MGLISFFSKQSKNAISSGESFHQNIPIHTALIFQRGWYIKLRWVAIAGIVSATMASYFLLHLKIHLPSLLMLAGTLTLFNIFYLIYNRFIYHFFSNKAYDIFFLFSCRIVLLQTGIDMIILALMLHFAGGIDNPCVFFFIFHIMLSSLLLPMRIWTWVNTLLASFLIALIALLEYFTIIPPYPIFETSSHLPNFEGLMLILGKIFILSITFVIVNYIGITIRSNLELQEKRISDASENIVRMEQSKSKFMQMVAHELKSPSAAIQSMLNAILTSKKYHIDSQALQFIDRCEKRAENLLLLTQDLLEYSKLQSLSEIDDASKKAAPFLLDRIIQEEIKLLEKQAESKSLQIQLVLNTPFPILLGDEQNWQKIVHNLISNAIRYTLPGGEIFVELRKEPSELLFFVRDTGIGIKKEDQAKLFTEFFRTTEAKRVTPQGTGLGLVITKNLVGLEGATIDLESEAGKGTTFCIHIPVTLVYQANETELN